MQLYACRPLKSSAAVMARQCGYYGLGWGDTDIRRESEFLVGQGLVDRDTNTATGEALYSITSQGILHHEQSHA